MVSAPTVAYGSLFNVGAIILRPDKYKTMTNIFHLRSDKELTHEDSKGPVVDRSVMTFVQDDLGGHILRSTTKGPGSTAIRHEFGETKINLNEIN